MSYTTFHKIKQLENGDFRVVTKCSNDNAPPREWVMKYYTERYPHFNHRQKEAAFILSGLYSGDKYYPEKYKRLHKLACSFSTKYYEETGIYPHPVAPPCSKEVYERETGRLENAKANGEYIPEYWLHRPMYERYEDYYNDAAKETAFFVNGFIAFVDSQTPISRIKAKIMLLDGKWVSGLRRNSRKIVCCEDESRAQVFHKTREEIALLMKKIPERYRPKMVPMDV